MKNELTEAPLQGGAKLQTQLLRELDKATEVMGRKFTDAGKQCVINAIAALVIYCKNNDIDLKELDPTVVRLALQNVGYTELNFAAIPSECYFDIRKVFETDDKGNKKFKGYSLAIKPQGAGNEKLLRRYGVNVKTLYSAWLVREGDDFTFPSFDGLNINPPKWTPKSYDKKVIMVVYPLLKTDNTVEYLISTREGIKPNLIAHIRQNALYKKGGRDEFYAQLDADAENSTVDELLKNPTYIDYINPTYISGGSKEQMILRKMKNNALKNYPKEYADTYMRDAVEAMFEDVDETVYEPANELKQIDTVEKVENEINEQPKEDAVPDWSVEEIQKEKEKVTINKPAPVDGDYGF